MTPLSAQSYSTIKSSDLTGKGPPPTSLVSLYILSFLCSSLVLQAKWTVLSFSTCLFLSPFSAFVHRLNKSGFRAFFLLKHRVEVGWGGVACAAGCMWGSENNLQDSVVSFPVTSQDSDSGCRPPWQMILPPHLSVPQKPSYVLFF